MSQLDKNYAEAIFQLSLEKGNLKDYHQTMKEIINVLENNKQFEDLLSNAFIEKKDRHAMIDNVFKNQVDHDILSFFHVIVENGRANRLLKILKSFNSLCNEHFNIAEGICYSPFKLNDDLLTQISDALSIKEGKKIFLVNRINKELIGGVKIIIGDRIYDSSVLTTIDTIKKNLLTK